MKKMTEMFAFVADHYGEEGIVTVFRDGVAYPLVTSDSDLVKSMRPVAEEAGKIHRRKVSLIKFTTRVDVECIS